MPNTIGMTSSANTLALMIPNDWLSGRKVTILECCSPSKRSMRVSANDALRLFEEIGDTLADVGGAASKRGGAVVGFE